MKTIERIYTLNWKYNYSVFETINEQAFGVSSRLLGSAVKPMNLLLSRSEELRILLPTLVGMNPTDIGWQEKITTWIHDIYIDVPRNGYEMDCSYVLDYGKAWYKDNIDYYFKVKGVDISKLSDRDREELFFKELTKTTQEGNPIIPEEDLYKYVDFVNKEAYIHYRYCLLSRKVANHVNEVLKSIYIDFYLASKEDKKKEVELKAKSRNEFLVKYAAIISDANKAVIDNMLIAGEKVFSLQELNAMSFTEKTDMLHAWGSNNPKDFLEFAEDKSLQTKALVYKYLWSGIFKKLEGTGAIVDAYDVAKVIGINPTECVAFFAMEANKEYITSIATKFKTLSNIN